MISIIIPTYNEQEHILKLVHGLGNHQAIEIIIVDGGSTDGTLQLLQAIPHLIVYNAPIKGRAAQLNYGASKAKHNILYFVHADVLVHDNYYNHITTAMEQGVQLGCYRYTFDSTSKLLKWNGYMTRYNGIWAGGGDQSLFTTKATFNKLNGYNDELLIMEDFDLIQRAKKQNLKLTILPYSITVSARKYVHNSWLRVQLANAVMVVAWRLGAPQHWLVSVYKKMLR